jgi:hypothetical protein
MTHTGHDHTTGIWYSHYRPSTEGTAAPHTTPSKTAKELYGGQYKEKIGNKTFVKVGHFGRFKKYGGYGPDQSWHRLLDNNGNPLAPYGKGMEYFEPLNKHAPEITPDDVLRVVCRYDTKHATPFTPYQPQYPVNYGLRMGEEMCGPLFYYYPVSASPLPSPLFFALFFQNHNDLPSYPYLALTWPRA